MNPFLVEQLPRGWLLFFMAEWASKKKVSTAKISGPDHGKMTKTGNQRGA